MSASIHRLIPVLFLLLFSGLVQAQDENRLELEKAQQKIRADITYNEKLLEETKKSKKLSSTEVVIIGKKIKQREELIATIRLEINVLQKQIDENSDLIESMEKDLKKLKEEYAKMIFQAYRTRSTYNKLMFVFASDDINQAFKRLKYLKQYADYRHKQAELIRETQEMLNVKIGELEQRKREKEELIGSELQEKSTLDSEMHQQQTVLKSLANKEKELKKELKKKRDEANALKKAIERAIAAELAKTKKDGKVLLTPEAMELSNNFTTNKGKLPWPLEKGQVTEYFGSHPHPVLKGITIKNNGLNFSTLPGSKARAVFSGQVSEVFIIPGSGKVVMVRHGEYITIYSNLQETYVKKGDQLKTKQEVGLVLTDQGKTDFHFELWKGTSILDPAHWLFKVK